MSNQCICLERIGDNGPCPVHAARYQKKITFMCQVEAFIGGSSVNQGDTLTARDLGNGLWAISGSWKGKEEFAHLNGRDVNRLAKMELVEVL